MSMTRRQFFTRTVGGVAGTMVLADYLRAEEPAIKLRVSACDWSLNAGGPGGMEIAKRVGLDGLEVSAGNADDKLKIADPAYRQEYKDNAKKLGIVVSSVAMTLGNSNPLASDPRAVAWIEQCIDAATDFGAKAMLLAFFGKGDLRDDGKLKMKEVDALVERLKAVAPKAEKAGVSLGLENTLSAKDNMMIIERVKSDAVKVYYDICNSTDGGYDVPAEIRMLGDRICQFHFKDQGDAYLGQGHVKMPPIAEAIKAIKYNRWICLETGIPSKDRDADFRKNAEYVRKLMG